jgi:hypothetical protein
MAFHTVKCNVLSVTPKGYNMGVVNYDHAGSNFLFIVFCVFREIIDKLYRMIIIYDTHVICIRMCHNATDIIWVGLCCLTPLSTIFQLHRGSQFYWWRKRRKSLSYRKSLTNFMFNRMHLAMFWPLCCLFFFDIQTVITPLVSSSSSYSLLLHKLHN